MTIRYISDLHFGHANVIAYDNRPFGSVGEMDDAMVSMWNSVVRGDDLTYVVGDFCWSQKYEDWVEILRRLKGRVFVIKGNHDRSQILKRLEKNGFIAGWSHQEIVKDGSNRVVVNHSPMPFFINEHQDNWFHLYGHVHVSYDWNMVLDMHRRIERFYMKKIRMYNVGCMVPYVKYVPRTLKEIVNGFDSTDLLRFKFSENHAWTQKETNHE